MCTYTYWAILWNDIYSANVFCHFNMPLLPRTDNLQYVEEYQSEVAQCAAHDNWKRLKTY